MAVDIKEIRDAARGRWAEILSALGGISPDLLDGKHHPCPKCGGTDRFSFAWPETGGVLCRQCFNKKNGDGIAALQWATEWNFKTTLMKLADYLGVKLKGRKKKKKDPPKIFATTKELIRKISSRTGGQFVRAWSYNIFHVLRFNLPTPDGEKPRKTFRPVYQVPLGSEGRMGWREGYPSGLRPLYRLAEISAAPAGDSPLIICGGEKATDAATGLGLLATTNAGGEAAVARTDWAPAARFARVIVAIDNDKAGESFGRQVTATLKKLRPDLQVKVICLPDLPPKGDIVEWIAAGGTREKFAELVEATPAITDEEIINAECKIIIGTDESRVIDEAIDALANCENIYQRGGCLVQIVEGTDPPRGIARPKEAPRIALMRFARIRELLADAAAWLRPAGDDDMEQIHPPDWVIKGIDARGQWSGICRLEAVVESPVLRADGSVLQTPGYDPLTGIVFRPQRDFPEIPNKPTRDCAVHARDALLEVVEDFPFAGDTHRAAWLAGVLTPLARYAFHGPAPLFLNDANVRGCGKSLLTDATSIVAAGREMARMSLPRDDDEFRKRITALAVAGEPLILIDNIAGPFGSPSLDAALTATSWSDRILGQTTMATAVPLYAVWFATGNNVVLIGDTARRVVHIRLESPLENPEERAGFHHTDLLAWVREERPRLTTASVIILAAFCAAGRPDMRLTPWGSFEGWSNLVRQAVVWIGLPDPGATRTELVTQADREAVALRQLITGWEEVDTAGVGMTVAAALRELAEYPTRYDTLRGALCELAPPRDGKTLNPRSVGMKLHHLRRRVVGGKFLDRREARQGAIWVVCGRDTCGTSTTSGTSPDSARTGARAHTCENLEGAEVSPASPASPAPADCFHDWQDTRNGDGMVKRTCRLCGEFYGYMQEAQQ